MASASRIGSCGGIGGENKDMNADDSSRVLEILVHYNSTVVESMKVTYKQDGEKYSTGVWGGTWEGTSQVNVILGSDEYLTSVKGFLGLYDGITVVTSLTFISNIQTFGPFGADEGILFELPGNGHNIVGFHARSGNLLDAIGIYVKSD